MLLFSLRPHHKELLQLPPKLKNLLSSFYVPNSILPDCFYKNATLIVSFPSSRFYSSCRLPTESSPNSFACVLRLFIIIIFNFFPITLCFHQAGFFYKPAFVLYAAVFQQSQKKPYSFHAFSNKPSPSSLKSHCNCCLTHTQNILNVYLNGFSNVNPGCTVILDIHCESFASISNKKLIRTSAECIVQNDMNRGAFLYGCQFWDQRNTKIIPFLSWILIRIFDVNEQSCIYLY